MPNPRQLTNFVGMIPSLCSVVLQEVSILSIKLYALIKEI